MYSWWKEGWKQIGKETGQVNINKDPVLVSLSSLRSVLELFDTGTELLPPPLDGRGKTNKKNSILLNMLIYSWSIS